MTARVALVSGGNSGIGVEVVRGLAQLGMVVYLGSRNLQRGEEALSSMADAGDIRCVALDLSDESTLRATLARIERDEGRLDILVNNAGASFSGNILEVEPSVVAESFQSNLHGPVRLTQLAVPLLKRGESPRIVNVSSEAGTFGYIANTDPKYVPYAYCGAKAALNAATVAFAVALQPFGMKVNAASPGLVNTRVSRFNGTRMPVDGARIILKLAMLGEDGPTGGFFNENGPVAW